MATENPISTDGAKWLESDAGKAFKSKAAKIERTLPPIAQRDVDELAANPVVVRIMTLWDVMIEGLSETGKRSLLWSIFETLRASFELKKGSAGRAS